MYYIQEVDFNSISEMRNLYYRQIIAPMDDFWEEGIIPSCSFYTYKKGSITGYYAINEEKYLVQFYVNDSVLYNRVFKEIITQVKITDIYVSTYDSLLYKACKTFSNNFEINTLLFKEDTKKSPIAPISSIIYRLATTSEVKRAVEYNKLELEDEGDWIQNYYEKLIKKSGLYFFMIGNTIVGTGESRKSISSKNIANIGVTVAKDYRRKGIATYIINTMREINNNIGYKTICSTTRENINSQKTLIKCGYKIYHLIYTVKIN